MKKPLWGPNYEGDTDLCSHVVIWIFLASFRDEETEAQKT